MKWRRPTLVGVLNVSPESTVPGSVATSPDHILRRAEALRRDGATYVEIGARSINPAAPRVSEAEEERRLRPALALLKHHGFTVAVETWSETTGQAMIREGADLINFSAGVPARGLYRLAGQRQVPVVLFFLPYDDPYAMRDSPCIRYGPERIQQTLIERAGVARETGCAEIWVDPNLGIFHPDVDVYEKILYQLQALRTVAPLHRANLRLMAYCPRKESLTSRIIMAALLLDHGVDCIRLHEPALITDLFRYR